MSAATIYTVRFRRRALCRWAGRLPRDTALITDAFRELLLDGNAASIKGLDFVAHVNARKRRRPRSVNDSA